MSENAPTQPVPPTPPGAPTPPSPHRPPHQADRPLYKEVWFIVTASTVAALLVFGAGFVSGGLVGFAIGTHHDVKHDRFTDMPMWDNDGMPWFDGNSGRERGRGQGPWGMSPDTAPQDGTAPQSETPSN